MNNRHHLWADKIIMWFMFLSLIGGSAWIDFGIILPNSDGDKPVQSQTKP